jgi:membrane-bound inhibitor of C-type lysozyme
MRLLSLCLLLLVAGCTTDDASPSPTAGEPHDTAARAPADLGGAESVTYRCETGRTVAAAYTSDSTVTLRYEGEVIDLVSARAASGARYEGEGYEWWSRGTGPGSEATLSRLEGDSAEPLEQCTAQG